MSKQRWITPLRTMAPLLTAVLFIFGKTLPSFALQPGDPAPDFSLPTSDGKMSSLKELKGHPVYVDFWASWCAPCRITLPWIASLQSKYGDKGLKVVLVNVDSDPKDGTDALQDLGLQLTTAFDPAGATPTKYDLKSMPSGFLIDSDGKVAAVIEGSKPEGHTQIEERLKSLLSPNIS